jgi:NTE family protein
MRSGGLACGDAVCSRHGAAKRGLKYAAPLSACAIQRVDAVVISQEVDMPARTALVLQGGGALGAYEFGAARALYEEPGFAPELIAGVSIGAVTAALLGRAANGLKLLEPLQSFWDEVKEPGLLFPPLLRAYASFFGNPHFYEPRPDFLNWPNWTYFYSIAPLRLTLADLINFTWLADRDAAPELLVSATDLEDGQIQYFYSREQGLTLDHIIASGSLPPAFPSTMIKDGKKEKFYWDGGLFDNTPLGAVLDRLDRGAGGPPDNLCDQPFSEQGAAATQSAPGVRA